MGVLTLVQRLSLALALVRLILHESEQAWPPKCERLWFGQFQSRRSGSHQRLTTSDGGFSAASISPPTSIRQLTREDCVRAHTQPAHVNSGATLKDACLETVLRGGFRSLFFEDTPRNPILGCVGIKIVKLQKLSSSSSTQDTESLSHEGRTSNRPAWILES